MGIHLSTRDLDRLQSATRTLLSPFEHPSMEAWGTAFIFQLARLIEADKSAVLLPVDGVVKIVADAADLEEAAGAYVRYYHTKDTGLSVKREHLGLEAWNRSMLWDTEELRRNEYYNDLCLPYRMNDAVGLAGQAGGGRVATVHLYSETAETFGEKEVTLLRLAVPALKSGLEGWARLSAARADLCRTLDALGGAFLLYDMRERALHATPALVRMLESEPEGARIRAEMDLTARSLRALERGGHPADPCGRSPGTWTLSTRSARYRIQGCFIGALIGMEGAVAVALERLSPSPPDPVELFERFRLTKQEVRVALLLAEGKTDAQIARALCISWHTARRHVERVLHKLGVHSRAAVAATIGCA